MRSRISKASRAFGCLQRSVLQNRHLSTDTKRTVYRAAVLSVLLYGAETWAVKANSLRRLSGFHNRCIRSIMWVTRLRQWWERITSRQLATAFGMEEKVGDILLGHRLRWLGHLARMESCRLPKQLLFGELEKKRPSHGVKRRWRDTAIADLKAVGIKEQDWYALAPDRGAWKAACRDGLLTLLETERYGAHLANFSRSNRAGNYPCVCGRHFRRQGDRTRHQRF